MPADIDASQYPSLVALHRRELHASTPTARPTASWARTSATARSTRLSARLRRLPAGPGPGQGRPRRGHDAQRAAVPGRGRRRSCAPAWSSSTSTRSTRRASSSTSSRTRAPRRSSSSRTSRTTLQQVHRGDADQARRARVHGRHARLPEGRARQLRGAQRQEDGAGVQPARRRALQRRARARARSGAFKPRPIGPDDVAVLQYTGGTTGVSKGAVLLHRNVVANVLQSEAWNQPALEKMPAGEQIDQRVRAAAVSHLRASRSNMMLAMRTGGKQHPDPESARPAGGAQGAVEAHVPQLPGRQHAVQRRWRNHPDFDTVDWSNLKISVGGGMAVQGAVAQALAREDRLPDLSRATACRRPRRRPPATRSTARPTPAPSACRCRAPELKLLDDDGNEVPHRRSPARSPSRARR